MTRGKLCNQETIIVKIDSQGCNLSLYPSHLYSKDVKPGLSSEELLDMVRDTGGVAVSIHPCRKGASVSGRVVRKCLCTIAEVRNGHNRHEENEKTEKLIHIYNLRRCSGSDAHSLDELGTVVTTYQGSYPITSRFIHPLKNNVTGTQKTELQKHTRGN